MAWMLSLKKISPYLKNVFQLSRRRLLSSNVFILGEEVSHALHNQLPVVALESTIITHGMPFPHNLETANAVEAIVRAQGAVPATVAVLDGRLVVGLSKPELEGIAKRHSGVMKVSRRDLGYALCKGQYGGTTVSATMIAAHKAGIAVFVTGGIGGVHRNATQSMDISADLTELGRTPVCVVCAGVKSILDIGLTLEYLETQGVAVVAYGQSSAFPAFFSPDSGFQAPLRVEHASKIAAMIDNSHRLGVGSGMVVGVPIPEECALDGENISNVIEMALHQASNDGVVGKEITPYVLEKVNQLTDGQSLKANIGLIKHNAKIGAEIAVNLQRLRSHRVVVSTQKDPHTRPTGKMQTTHRRKNSARPVVIGGSNVDLVAKADAFDVMVEATNDGHIYQSYGGVARNVAECLHRFGKNPLLISAVGDDSQGKLLLQDLISIDMDTDGVLVSSDHPTAAYCAVVNSSGDLVMGIGDMNLHQSITKAVVSEFEEQIVNAPMVCIDGNLSLETMQYILKLCHRNNVPVWFEPTCIEKSKAPFTCWDQATLQYASPNINELNTINAAVLNRQRSSPMILAGDENDGAHSGIHVNELLENCVTLAKPLLGRINNLMVTLGRNGVLLVCRGNDVTSLPGGQEAVANEVVALHYPISSEDSNMNIVSVSGAGDSFVGGFIAAKLSGLELDTSIKTGMYAASLSLRSHCPISPSLAADLLSNSTVRDWYKGHPMKISLKSTK